MQKLVYNTGTTAQVTDLLISPLLDDKTQWVLVSSSVSADGNKIYRFRNLADQKGIERVMTISVNPLKNVYNNKRFSSMLTKNKLASTRGTNISVSIEDTAATYDAGSTGSDSFASSETEFILPIWSNFSFNYPVDCKLLTAEDVVNILKLHLGDIIANVSGLGLTTSSDITTIDVDLSNTVYYGVYDHAYCCSN